MQPCQDLLNPLGHGPSVRTRRVPIHPIIRSFLWTGRDQPSIASFHETCLDPPLLFALGGAAVAATSAVSGNPGTAALVLLMFLVVAAVHSP